ncbi:MAG: AhpC/TSA family protein [Bacteroidetes bacterium]|nr:AhpC/TSA family protein [Bacteroidota bacterium]
MRNVSLLLLLLPLWAAAQPSTCTITGHLEGLGHGRIHIGYEYDTAGRGSKGKHTTAHHGDFSIHMHIDGPRICRLYYSHRKVYYYKLFFADTGVVSITGRLDSMAYTTIRGSEVVTTYDEEQRQERIYIDRMKAPAGDSAARAAILATDRAAYHDLRDYQRRFVAAHPSSIVSAQVLMASYYYDMKVREAQPLYALLTPEAAQTLPGRMVYKQLAIGLAYDSGHAVTDIVLPDMKGQSRSLSATMAAHRVVLLDFWAAGCAPCRGENKSLVAIYQQYHARGFEVYAVSLDDSKRAWQAAIAHDSIPWPINVSDLKGWDSAPAKTYGVSAIPYNILISDGLIVANDIHGDALSKKLATLLP